MLVIMHLFYPRNKVLAVAVSMVSISNSSNINSKDYSLDSQYNSNYSTSFQIILISVIIKQSKAFTQMILKNYLMGEASNQVTKYLFIQAPRLFCNH